jgi:hypothetical protein
MGNQFSHTLQVAIAGETTGSGGQFYVQLYCNHSWVNIELAEGGIIGELCTICDQVSIKPEWIYYGRVREPVQSRGELFGRALTRAMGKARTIRR